jgi:hypothetical protein
MFCRVFDCDDRHISLAFVVDSNKVGVVLTMMHFNHLV